MTTYSVTVSEKGILLAAPVLSSSLVSWYDASDNTTITQASGTVSQLLDKSPSGATLSQATAGHQPAYSSSALNSLPSLVFTPANTDALSTSAVVSAFNPGCSIFVVMNNTGNGHGAWVSLGGYGSGGYSFGKGSTSLDSSAGDGQNIIFTIDGYATYATGAALNSGANLVSMTVSKFSAGVFTAYLNGAQVYTQSGVSGGANPSGGGVALGTVRSVSTRYNNDDISEVIVFNTALSAYYQQVVQGYLAWKWSLQTQLASTHPFYSAAPGLSALDVQTRNSTLNKSNTESNPVSDTQSRTVSTIRKDLEGIVTEVDAVGYQYTGTTLSSATVTLPLGAPDKGDYLLLSVSCAGAKTVTPPSGFTLVNSILSSGNSVLVSLYSKYAGSSETAAQSFSISSSGSAFSASLYRFKNVSPLTAIHSTTVYGSNTTGWVTQPGTAVANGSYLFVAISTFAVDVITCTTANINAGIVTSTSSAIQICNFYYANVPYSTYLQCGGNFPTTGSASYAVIQVVLNPVGSANDVPTRNLQRGSINNETDASYDAIARSYQPTPGTVADTLFTSDTEASNVSVARSLGESDPSADSETSGITRSQTNAETVTSSDSASRSISLQRGSTESATTSDSTTGTRSLARAFLISTTVVVSFIKFHMVQVLMSSATAIRNIAQGAVRSQIQTATALKTVVSAAATRLSTTASAVSKSAVAFASRLTTTASQMRLATSSALGRAIASATIIQNRTSVAVKTLISTTSVIKTVASWAVNVRAAVAETVTSLAVHVYHVTVMATSVAAVTFTKTVRQTVKILISSPGVTAVKASVSSSFRMLSAATTQVKATGQVSYRMVSATLSKVKATVASSIRIQVTGMVKTIKSVMARILISVAAKPMAFAGLLILVKIVSSIWTFVTSIYTKFEWPQEVHLTLPLQSEVPIELSLTSEILLTLPLQD